MKKEEKNIVITNPLNIKISLPDLMNRNIIKHNICEEGNSGESYFGTPYKDGDKFIDFLDEENNSEELLPDSTMIYYRRMVYPNDLVKFYEMYSEREFSIYGEILIAKLDKKGRKYYYEEKYNNLNEKVIIKIDELIKGDFEITKEQNIMYIDKFALLIEKYPNHEFLGKYKLFVSEMGIYPDIKTLHEIYQKLNVEYNIQRVRGLHDYLNL